MTGALLSELRQLIDRHAGTTSVRPDRLPGVILGRESAPTAPCPQILDPVFSLIVQGRKRMTVADVDLAYADGQFMIIAVEMPIDAHVVEASEEIPLLGFGLSLQPEIIAELLSHASEMAVSRYARKPMTVSHAGSELLEPVTRLLRLLDQPADIPILAKSVEREIVWRLLNGPQGALVRQIGVADSHAGRIGRAARWLREHFAEAIRIEDVAAVAGMSVTSLHRHFKALTRLTPIQYQKQLRLQAARTRLMGQKVDVADLGFSVGYDSPSQFSREYRRMFGNSPGEDGKKLRAGLPALDTASAP